mmetsp:Transcript_5462/g.21601  ORF Transcript_5462/g.21601 Transcript_5462/m.21601 type:complete len:86 (-) Transcript_5462:692-949(-)
MLWNCSRLSKDAVATTPGSRGDHLARYRLPVVLELPNEPGEPNAEAPAEAPNSPAAPDCSPAGSAALGAGSLALEDEDAVSLLSS